MDYLIHLLVEQSRISGMKSGGGLKPKAYTAIEKGMIEKFGPEFTRERIKNKLKYAKPNLTVMKEMLNTSGFGYDPVNKCIEVDSQVWNDYVEKYPNRKKYRGPKLWRYYDEFVEVYGESHATGSHAITFNSALQEDPEPIPCTPVSQSSPMFMQVDSEQSFTQTHNDDSPLQSPEPPPPTTNNLTTSTCTRRSKRYRSTNDDIYYNLLNGIAQNVDALTQSCKAMQKVYAKHDMEDTSFVQRTCSHKCWMTCFLISFSFVGYVLIKLLLGR